MKRKGKQLRLIIVLVILALGLMVPLFFLEKTQEVRKGAFYGGITASLWPSEKEVEVGKEFGLYLKINPVSGGKTYLITGVDLNLKYNSQLLELVKVEIQPPYTGPSFKKDEKKGDEEGRVRLLAVTTASRDEIPKQVFDLAKFTFKAKTLGSSTVARVGEYQIVGSRGQVGDIDRTLKLTSFSSATVTANKEGPTPVELPSNCNQECINRGFKSGYCDSAPVYPGQTLCKQDEVNIGWTQDCKVASGIVGVKKACCCQSAGGPTPTEPPGGWPVLKFKIKFEGTEYEVGEERIIVENIPPQKVRVAVKKGDFQQTYEDVTVTCDQEAVCQGELELTGVSPGDGYAVLIKGPVHLAKKFCRDQQEEHCWRGEENISLTTKENEFNWTKAPLEPGDVNYDKRVDSLDFSQVKMALGSKGENIPEDVNFNGEVNSQDLIFILSTLSTKYEDEL